MLVRRQNEPEARCVSSHREQWMRLLRGLFALAALAVGFAHGARAHSLDDIDAMLQSDEKYFQQIDKPMRQRSLICGSARINNVPASINTRCSCCAIVDRSWMDM